LTGNLTAGNYTYSSETGDLPEVERHYYTFAPGMSWAWTEELKINSRYEYRHIKRVTDDHAVASNIISLTLEYTWPKMSLSR
jgi:hypothetical protein